MAKVKKFTVKDLKEILAKVDDSLEVLGMEGDYEIFTIEAKHCRKENFIAPDGGYVFDSVADANDEDIKVHELYAAFVIGDAS